MNVMIVEDDPDCRDLLRTTLELDGHAVFEACTGEEAIALVDASAPDFVLMDLSLSESQYDGTETMKRLRQIEALSHVPIVAVSAHAMAEHRRQAMAAGFDDYVTKPFAVEALLRLVSTLRRR